MLPTNPSKSFIARNPHLYPNPEYEKAQPIGLVYHPNSVVPPKKRLRQSSKPLMNKLETEYLNHLQSRWDNKFYPQAMTFRLASGLKYTADFFAFDFPWIGESSGPTAFEVKGPWFPEHNRAKIKMFATTYPEIRVLLVWLENGVWQSQRILP